MKDFEQYLADQRTSKILIEAIKQAKEEAPLGAIEIKKPFPWPLLSIIVDVLTVGVLVLLYFK